MIVHLDYKMVTAIRLDVLVDRVKREFTQGYGPGQNWGTWQIAGGPVQQADGEWAQAMVFVAEVEL